MVVKMAGFTIAQVDRMTSYVVKNELLALGVDPASIQKLRVAQLRERLKDELVRASGKAPEYKLKRQALQGTGV